MNEYLNDLTDEELVNLDCSRNSFMHRFIQLFLEFRRKRFAEIEKKNDC